VVGLTEGGVVGLTKEVAVGAAVAVGVKVEVGEGVTGVGEGVSGSGDGEMEGDGAVLGVGFDGRMTSTFLSIALPGMTRSRYVDAISTWTG
jgi:hypothetical protein